MEGLKELPDELIYKILSLVGDRHLYDSFIDGSDVSGQNCLIRVSLIRLCENMVFRNPSTWEFYAGYNRRKVDHHVVLTYKEGVELVRKLGRENYGTGQVNGMYGLKEITLVFDFVHGKAESIRSEYNEFVELLVLLHEGRGVVCDFSVFLSVGVEVPLWVKEICDNFKQKLWMLNDRLVAMWLSIHNDPVGESGSTVDPFGLVNFTNLHDVAIFSHRADRRKVHRWFHGSLDKLRCLLLSNASIETLRCVPRAINVERLILRGCLLDDRSIIVLQYLHNLEYLDLSFNSLCDLSKMRFPKRLKELKLATNKIRNIGNLLPENLISLDLSGNVIYDLDGLVLPEHLKTLQLNRNFINGLPRSLFERCKGLLSIDLSDNEINDFDDIGEVLPDSIEVLSLSNNTLDYPVLTGILKPHLRVLSLCNTDLVILKDVKFPDSLQELDLSLCNLQEISNVVFGGGNLTKLNLSSNDLEVFDLQKNGIYIDENLRELDLSYNRLLKEVNLTGLRCRDRFKFSFCNLLDMEEEREKRREKREER